MPRDFLGLTALALVGVSVGGCNGGPAASRSAASAPSLHEVYTSSVSGLVEPQRSVLTDDADWTSLWSTVTANESPAPARPAIDLTQQSVIVAALGQRPTGGFSIHIDSIRGAGGGRDVFVTTTRPGPTCATTQAMTQPVHIVTAPATAGPTRFVEAETTKDCGS